VGDRKANTAAYLRPRRAARRDQGNPGPVDRADRGRQVLARGWWTSCATAPSPTCWSQSLASPVFRNTGVRGSSRRASARASARRAQRRHISTAGIHQQRHPAL